jgi:hypothetical protein
MTKRIIMVVTMVGCLLAWSSLALATPTAVTLTQTDYDAWVYAGTDSISGSGNPVSISKIAGGASAHAQGPQSGNLLYCDATAASGTGAGGYITAVLTFKAPCTTVDFSCNYEMVGITSGTSASSAWILGYFDDYYTTSAPMFNISVNASSEAGNPYNESDYQSDFGNFQQSFSGLIVGDDYIVTLQANWVDATGTDAFAYAKFTTYSLTYDCSPVPVPGAVLLLGAGLVRLLGQLRKGKN